MIALGQHAEYILLAYLGVALCVGALIVAVAARSRGVKARLAALEAQGVRRRSEDSA